MPDPVFFLSRFHIKEGRLTAVRQMMSHASAGIQAEKPRTLLFLAYMDADGGRISFLHAFADADSMDQHFVGSEERSRAAYEDIEPLGWEVYGRPSSAALDTLRQAAESAGVSLAVHPEYLAGFLRLEPSGQVS